MIWLGFLQLKEDSQLFLLVVLPLTKDIWYTANTKGLFLHYGFHFSPNSKLRLELSTFYLFFIALVSFSVTFPQFLLAENTDCSIWTDWGTCGHKGCCRRQKRNCRCSNGFPLISVCFDKFSKRTLKQIIFYSDANNC